ncbi:hypothetical protein HDU85_007488 [Gaertneriomyces sp. JEL0708]|nr:hypothetical protein HDU85_007488 [Gaertneriomyces sp. JEL0708]
MQNQNQHQNQLQDQAGLPSYPAGSYPAVPTDHKTRYQSFDQNQGPAYSLPGNAGIYPDAGEWVPPSAERNGGGQGQSSSYPEVVYGHGFGSETFSPDRVMNPSLNNGRADYPSPNAPVLEMPAVPPVQPQPQTVEPRVQMQTSTVLYNQGNQYTDPQVNIGPATVTIGDQTITLPSQDSVNFHIYREGWVSRDCRIMTADKKTCAYHIEYPRSFLGSWHVNMRRSSSHGPTVFLITKAALGWDFTIQDPSRPALSTKLVRTDKLGIGKRAFRFRGFDGKEYAWKGSGGIGGDLKLVVYPTKHILAYYHRTKRAWAKEGRLEILPGAHYMLDLVVATGFAVEEWERQNR